MRVSSGSRVLLGSVLLVGSVVMVVESVLVVVGSVVLVVGSVVLVVPWRAAPCQRTARWSAPPVRSCPGCPGRSGRCCAWPCAAWSCTWWVVGVVGCWVVVVLNGLGRGVQRIVVVFNVLLHGIRRRSARLLLEGRRVVEGTDNLFCEE